MPKNARVKINVAERVEDNICDLSLAGLVEVPVRQIAAFKRVNVLDLSSNNLVSLGWGFTTLQRLIKLDLSRNQLESLPEDFGVLRCLKHLELYDNKLDRLPLSFGKLKSLRYLDLKGNPLAPQLQDVVGFSSTTKDCQDAAQRTVKFMEMVNTMIESEMTAAADAARLLEKESNKNAAIIGHGSSELKVFNGNNGVNNGGNNNNNNNQSNGFNKLGKNKSKKNKQMNKKLNGNNQNQNHNHNHNNGNNGTMKSHHSNGGHKTNNMHINNANIAAAMNSAAAALANSGKLKKKSNIKNVGGNGGGNGNGSNAAANNNNKKPVGKKKTAIAFISIFAFFTLLAINVGLIYLVMFKNPQIAEMLVECIPPQYRDWILHKTEFFRFHVSEWISKFQTPPEEQ